MSHLHCGVRLHPPVSPGNNSEQDLFLNQAAKIFISAVKLDIFTWGWESVTLFSNQPQVASGRTAVFHTWQRLMLANIHIKIKANLTNLSVMFSPGMSSVFALVSEGRCSSMAMSCSFLSFCIVAALKLSHITKVTGACHQRFYKEAFVCRSHHSDVYVCLCVFVPFTFLLESDLCRHVSGHTCLSL